ncbi:MAG: ROK family transcriptional regulator [Bacteroidota bacterium]
MLKDTKSRHDQIISANSKVVRNINRGNILHCIRERQPISRSEIARATKLNKTTVSSIVGSLVRENLLTETVQSTSTVGRRPISLELKRGHNFYGAISIDSGTTRVAVVDVDGTIRHTDKMLTRNAPAKEFIDESVSRLIQMRVQNGLGQFKGVGVSVAGIVDPTQRQVVFAPHLGWYNVPIGEILAQRFPDSCVTAVENDANSAALAEMWFGKQNVRLSNFIFLSVGRGIGAGIVIDRRILRGESYFAGEFGHMVLVEGGELCACGNHGCWEAYASDQSTVRRYYQSRKPDRPEEELTIDDVITAARSEETEAIQELKSTGYWLGLGIANIVKAVDPAIIVVGGHITRVWDLIADEVISSSHRRSFTGNGRGPAIVATSLMKRPSLLGAAALAMSKSFGEVRVTR